MLLIRSIKNMKSNTTTITCGDLLYTLDDLKIGQKRLKLILDDANQLSAIDFDGSD